MNTSRRGFLKVAGGGGLFAIGGCACPFGAQKIRMAAVGIMGKGYTDWLAMLKTGMVEMVAFCDCDYTTRERAQQALAKDGVHFDLYSKPFYTDYRKLLDDAGWLGIDAITVSTPDHVHAPVAIQAMKQGIHVFVQKPLVRTLWELDYFGKTAREHGVITQMGNQGSGLDMMRRCTELLQAGIIGEATEVHVWTNRPVWPQGKAVSNIVKNNTKGDKVRNGLNWDAWLATAAERPFLDRYPEGAKVYDPWNLGKNVYHSFTWRGFFDFGTGAFGDMACHTMNLAFRGLELESVSGCECLKIVEPNDIAYPTKSIVKLTYKARASKARPGVNLPPVDLYWYDGYVDGMKGRSGMKPSSEIMPKVVSTFGEVPNTGCYIIGTKGAVLMRDDYGAKCSISMNEESKFVDVFEHEASKSVKRVIPYCQAVEVLSGESTVEMKGFGAGQVNEFVNAILGRGPVIEQVHSRCFSDVEYSIPQMEGILVGCIAQRVPGKHVWDSASQRFSDENANQFLRPYIRKGWEF